MTPHLLFYQLLLVTLGLICLIIHVWWPDPPIATPQTPLKPNKPYRKRSKEPKPFTGLIHKPLCEACAGYRFAPQGTGIPSVLTFTEGRRRTVNTELTSVRSGLLALRLPRRWQPPL